MTASASDLPIVLAEVGILAGEVTILDRISITLLAGAPTLLIGPNGSGKTTLLRAAMGLIPPSHGRITWGGREVSPPTRRAIVFQRPVMLRRSAAANVRYAPIVKDRTGITVNVIAQGTGQALDTGRRGDADVVFVHAKSAELKFLAEGEGLKRYPVMYNGFVLIGPKSDPAGIRGLKDVGRELKAIKDKGASFISRGDRSGTHVAELALWSESGVDIEADKGSWYKSIGQGMGAALNVANASNAYVPSDRATWIRLQNKGNLQIMVEGDAHLFNQYGLMLVNPDKHPNVKRALGQRFIDYLTSPDGQNAIANYKISGEQLFHPDADGPGA